jgi:hypothetical protein
MGGKKERRKGRGSGGGRVDGILIWYRGGICYLYYNRALSSVLRNPPKKN